MFDYLIVGAGFAGSVIAERLANEAGKIVLIIDMIPATTSAATHTTITTTTASSYTNTAPTFFTPIRAKFLSTFRSSPSGDPTNTESLPALTVNCCQFRSILTRSTNFTD